MLLVEALLLQDLLLPRLDPEGRVNGLRILLFRRAQGERAFGRDWIKVQGREENIRAPRLGRTVPFYAIWEK